MVLKKAAGVHAKRKKKKAITRLWKDQAIGAKMPDAIVPAGWMVLESLR
jgi:hypothetical protein